MHKNAHNHAIYWIDRFVVPPSSMSTFAEKLSEIYDFVKNLAGCRRREILEKVSGDGNVNVVILVEWENASAMEEAREALVNWRSETGFSPIGFTSALGVKADFSQYSVLEQLA